MTLTLTVLPIKTSLKRHHGTSLNIDTLEEFIPAIFFFFFFRNVQLSNSNQYPSLLFSVDYVHALLWDVPTNQLLSSFDPHMRERSETSCVILIIDPFLPEYSL